MPVIRDLSMKRELEPLEIPTPTGIYFCSNTGEKKPIFVSRRKKGEKKGSYSSTPESIQTLSHRFVSLWLATLSAAAENNSCPFASPEEEKRR